MRLFRIALFFVTMLLLAVAAILALPDQPEATPRTSIVFDTFAGPDGFELPADWEAVDPFGSSTPYYGLLWYHEMPRIGSRVALVRRADQPAELMLMVARKEAVAGVLAREKARFVGHPQVEVQPVQSVPTATGEQVELRVARVKNPVHPEGDTTYILGSAQLDNDLVLVINGGAITGAFNMAEITEIIRGLRVPTAPLAH